MGEIAGYCGHPSFGFPHHDSRCVYVVEPAAWGCYVHAQSKETQDLRIEVEPISEDRASELLA